MEKCLQCSKELKHVPGRKQKSFCDVNCRNKYFYAKRKQEVELAKAALVSLPADYVNIKKVAILTEKGEGKPLLPKPPKKPKKPTRENLNELVEFHQKANTEAYDAPPLPKNIIDELKPDNLAIQLQIDAIKKEVCPKERDTPMGRKSWQMDQHKRIQELQNKLK